MRITWMLSAETALDFPDSSTIRFLDESEAGALAETVRKRNVFARHSWENDFYLKRIGELSNHTVIEVFRPGEPQEMGEEAEKVADFVEKLAVLSSTLVLPRKKLQKRLGVSSRPRTEVDFIVGCEYRYLRSRMRSVPVPQGICVDEPFRRRFSKCGFYKLYGYCLSNGDLADRVLSSLDWLFESRREPRLSAAVVKTAIALESLLIFHESESLARSLSERAAFILSSSPNTREQISRIVKRFYNARSGVVHGGRKNRKALTPSLVEAVDRLSVLICLLIAANPRLWKSVEDLRTWCESQRWGAPSTEVAVPFSRAYLKNAIALSQKR
jgi:hypothetical protein